jgi:hypothetical protein
MPDSNRDDLIDVLEEVAKAQLRTLRGLRRRKAEPGVRVPRRSKSNMDLVEDILREAGGPLHVREIILRAGARFGRVLRRESLVSALTKRVLDQHTFRRVGRNTFDLIEREEAER